MTDQTKVYHATCKRCKARVAVDMETLYAADEHAKWRRATVATIRNLRGVEGGQTGTVRRLTWLCPRCGWVHTSQTWEPDEFQQFPMDGLE